MISNTFQNNTFLQGMNMDTDVSMIPDSQYRYAENVRIMTNDEGTTGVLQNIEGVKKYNATIPFNEVVIGVTTINQIAIVVTRLENGYNKVYRVTGFDSNTPVQTLILHGQLRLCEDLKKTPNLSIVGNYETDTNIKVYFTDGKSSVKVLNVVDNKYVFGSELVDKDGYIINPLALDITPGATLPPFELVNLTTGNLPSGSVQYCYQLFNLHNSETTLAPLSGLIHLTQTSTNQDSQQYMGAYPNTSSGKACVIEAPLITKDFNRCRVISIRYTSNNSIPKIIIVDEIEVLASQDTIKYIDTGNSYMGEITVDEFNNLTGYQFIAATLTKLQNRLFAADITEDTWNPGWYDARVYRCNASGTTVLESANSTNNITLNDLDTADLTTIPSEHDCINPYNGINFPSSNTNNRYIYGKKLGDTRPLGGYGLNIEYNFTTIPIELSEVQAQARLDNNCSMNVRPKQMSSIVATNVGYNTTEVIQFKDTSTQTRIPNYADPYISSHFKGYQRDEVYRFGIIFYNDKSLPSPVYWIGDIKMPHASQINPFTYVNNQLKGQALGIKFTVKNIPNGAVGYEIVRCDRTEADRSVMMQCIGTNLYEYRIQENSSNVGLGSILKSSVETRPFIFPEYNAIDRLYTNNDSKRVDQLDGSQFIGKTAVLNNQLMLDNYIRLISPEICVQQDNIEKYIKDSAYLDYLYTYASPIEIETSRNKTRLFAHASKTLQYDGSISTSRTDRNFVIDNDPAGKIVVYFEGRKTNDEEMYYNADIAKYYYTVTPTNSGSGSIVPIADVKYPLDIPYNAFQDVSPYRINVGERTYTNYAMSCFDKNDVQTVVGAAGPCLVALVSGLRESLPAFDSPITGTVRLDYVNMVPVFNIKVASAAPYGGDTYVSRQNSVYISTNSYVSMVLDSSYKYSTYTYGGDTFLNVLDYPCTFTFQGNDEQTWRTVKRYIGAYIPFESSINMNLFNGDMAHRTYTSDNYLDSHMQLDITQKGSYHVQDRPYYVYNSVYSSQMGSKKFVPNSIYAEDYTRMYNRIITSQAKTNNEILDNWTTFKVADYLDVDNQYGDITNLRAFKDKLFYWQNTALGIAAVNERVLISDDNISELTLGTGGILSRFDYITTTNGSSIKNDRSIVNSDNVLYWYDFDKNEICAYTGQVQAISKEKQVQSYLNELFDNKRNVALSLYDKKYNEVWFKFYNKSLIFNEQLGRFTSFYTFNPDWALQFSNKVVTIRDNAYFIINSLDTDGLDKVDKTAKIQFVVNKDAQYTKVFDNVRLSGEFRDSSGKLLTTYAYTTSQFKTKHQETELEDTLFDYREDTYRFPIPRQKVADLEDSLSYPARMRGKYLICDYSFDSNNESTFKIPYITTTYRYSLI